MSYRLVIRGGNDLTVSDERGQKLKELKLSVNPPKDIELNDDMYQLSQITSIIHIPGQDHVPLAERQQTNLLPGKKRCRGEFSIQKEINDMIKSDLPATWGKDIGDKTLREKYYRQLTALKGVLWCDYKKQECHCA